MQLHPWGWGEGAEEEGGAGHEPPTPEVGRLLAGLGGQQQEELQTRGAEPSGNKERVSPANPTSKLPSHHELPQHGPAFTRRVLLLRLWSQVTPE